MVRLMLISPRKLFEHSFLAGTILSLAALTLVVDLALIGLRGYAYNLVSGWTQLDEVGGGLEAISYSCLVALVWYIVLAFLLIDVIATLLLPSRDLQEGAVISFGVIAIMQIPLVALFLKWELSWFNATWLQTACLLTQHSTSCADWWTGVRIFSLTTSLAALILHLLLLGLCAYYVHTRPSTTPDLLYRRHGKAKHARKKLAKQEAMDAREKRKNPRKKAVGKNSYLGPSRKRKTGRYDGYGSDGSMGSLDGMPPPTRAADSPSPPRPRGDLKSTPSAVHTDSEASDSDVEKQPLRR